MTDDSRQILRLHIKDLERSFGSIFGLKAFPDEKFCIMHGACYVSEYQGRRKVMIYAYRWNGEQNSWEAFSKASPDECREQFKRQPDS